MPNPIDDATGIHGGYTPAQQTAEERRLATLRDLEHIIDNLDARGLTAGELIDQAGGDVDRIDQAIRERMANMSARNDRAAAIRGVTEAFQAFMNQPAGTAGRFDLNSGAIVVAGLNEGRPMTYAQALAEAHADPTTLGNFHGSIDRSNPEGFKGYLQGQQQSVSDGAELDSLQLQSLVSQRNQVLQMTSQLIAAMTETSKGIVGHIGR